MKTKGFFITGTGTGVGKSVVMAALLRRLARRGRVLGVKPVQTGCEEIRGEWFAPDPELWKMALADVMPMPDLFCPCRLAAPCSPHLAARLAGIDIDLESLAEEIGRRSEGGDFVLVEGAGGLLVPIRGDKTMLDLAGRLGLPLLLVADNRLGVINHTLLSLAAIRGAGLPLSGVILNNTTPAADNMERLIRNDNRETIRSLGQVAIVAEMPYIPNFSPDNRKHWEVLDASLRQVV
ncbi:MAG: dethiobiotin synthase [Deltaproteobacteria bacterium]|nr:dethiobiotin synthase [Deltaproteobacteria bacterium]